MRVQLHQLISPGHRGGPDMRKEQMSRHLIHRERPVIPKLKAKSLNGRKTRNESVRERPKVSQRATGPLRRSRRAARHSAARSRARRTIHE